MIKVCQKYNLMSKEHNGDYIPPSVIKEKFSLGLNAINIAPEFGEIETQVILEKDMLLNHEIKLVEKVVLIENYY